MHIPDGFLGAPAAVAGSALAAGGLALALRAERREPAPPALLGSLAAFVFAAQMINVPVAPGTSGHLVGATLLAMLVGPWAGAIVMAAVLLIQAVFFQDGGLTAFGANLLDMGFAAGLVGWAVAGAVARAAPGPRGLAVGSMFGAFVGTLAAALLAALWLGASGLYPLGGIVPLMLVTHAAIGVLEAALTGAVMVTVLRWRPDLVRGVAAPPAAQGTGRVVAAILGVALLVAAFLAPFASRLPDGLERTARALGFEERARPLVTGSIEGSPIFQGALAPLAPTLAGLIGTIVVALLAWITTRGLAAGRHATHR